MILPFTKVFSLSIRLFTRPVVNYAKAAVRLQTKRSVALRTFLISSGEQYHRLHYHTQKLFLTTSIADQYFKPLSEEKALEAGAEFVGEIVVYGVLFLWGIYELDKTQKESKVKEEDLSRVVARIKEKMQDIHDTCNSLSADLQRLQQLRTEAAARKKE